jgi:hypothetical protein
MANIMLKCSDYGNKGLGKTPFLAIYSQSTHNTISASVLANLYLVEKFSLKHYKNFEFFCISGINEDKTSIN